MSSARSPYSVMLAGPAPYSDSQLPPYSCRDTLTDGPRIREPVAHIVKLADGKKKPWATLKLLSSANSTKHLPIYYQREPIVGSFELNLEKDDAIQSVSVIVTGSIITGVGVEHSYTFLDQRSKLWSKAMGDPRTPPTGAYTGKLRGDYVWSLSIELPNTVTFPKRSGEGGQVFRLPQTFSEQNTMASIQYNLKVRISRSTFRSDSILSTNFAYVPVIRPDPLSFLRKIAYQESNLLPGPETDPEGWKTTAAVVTHGSLFATRHVLARCKLSLANPLCYTRGSAIPCILDIECNDRNALDILSATTAATVVLQRRVKFFVAAGSGGPKKEVGWKEVVEDVNRAVWWPSVEGARTCCRDSRRLDGEIHLPKDLQPTSAVAHFSVNYVVVVRPFQDSSFKSKETEPLLVEPVEIATRYAKGPKPKPFSPPAYDSSTKPKCRLEFNMDLESYLGLA